MPEFCCHDGVCELPRDEWNALVGGESPFLEWEWLSALEEGGAVDPERGWAARPLVAREDGRLVAACPLYAKGHSEGEFVFDWSWADAARRAGIRYYPKLLVGVPFTPVAGARLLVAPGEDAPRRRSELAAALRALCTRWELSSVHVNFCREEELVVLGAEGFLPRMGLQYHWHNEGYRSFDDFLGRLRSRRRNQIRRERRVLAEAGIRVEVHRGDEIPDELFEATFAFYRATVTEHPYGRQYLDWPVFEKLRERFRHRLCFLVARRGEEILGGTFNVEKGDTLYGRYWGALAPVRFLHFEVCYYRAIEYCIERGLARFEPGAGGEYKQMRGFDARPTWSAHYLADPRLRRAVAEYLDLERREVREAESFYLARSALKERERRPGARRKRLDAR